MTLREMLMRKINGVPTEAHTDLSNLTGGEVLKWSGTNMAWEDQDSTGFVPTWYGGRGVFGGGWTPPEVNVIDYITIATPSNATDFGDLSLIRSWVAACSDGTKGVFGGGWQSDALGRSDTIDYVTIQTTGNATDFGNLTVSRGGNNALSGD